MKSYPQANLRNVLAPLLIHLLLPLVWENVPLLDILIWRERLSLYIPHSLKFHLLMFGGTTPVFIFLGTLNRDLS